MILSKPITHPDAPERQGYIRGKYESVELIREIPLSNDNPELNPVEWIMITRSDPGGGIPRFMVDRGTPSSMLGDIHKWLDWATVLNETEEVETQAAVESTATAQEPVPVTTTAPVASDGPADVKSTPAPPAYTTTAKAKAPEPAPQQEEGVVSHLTQALEIGIDNYAPTMVSSYMHNRTDSTPKTLAADDDSDSSSDTSSSAASFMSAEEMRRQSTAEETPPTKAFDDDAAASTSQISLASLDTLKTTRSPTHHEKEVTHEGHRGP